MSDEEFVLDLIKECPEFAPDERQANFFGDIDEARRVAKEQPEVISMKGFPASHANLGWLKDAAVKIITLDPSDHYRASKMILNLLDKTVQRLKILNAFPNYETRQIEIIFVTQDDHGYYRYEFAVGMDGGEYA